MYKTILMILALLVATLSAPVWAEEEFGINWETATPEDVRGIDPNAKNRFGETPLYYANHADNIPAIIVLLQAYEKYGHLLAEGAAGQNQASETSAEKHPSCRYPDQGKRFADSELIELDAVSRTKDKVYQSGECVYGSGMAADAAECVVETKIWEGEFLYTPGSKCKKSVGDISVCTTTNYASDKYRCGIKYHNGYYSSLSDSSPVIKVKDPAKGYKDRFAACFEPYKLMLTKGVDKDEYKCIGDPQNE